MTALTLTAREFRTLVEPVLPLAGRDDQLPVLCALLIEADGKWLSASATDRFRVGIKRIEKRATDDDPTTEWPEFKALIPTRAVRSLLTTFKPRRGTLDPTLTFKVDGNKMTADAVGLFDLFDSGRFVHTLLMAEYPDVRAIIQKAIDKPVEERVSHVALNPTFLADFKATGNQTLRFLIGAARSPVMVTDDDGFIGAIMPRREDQEREDWSDFLAPKAKPEPKKRAARKPKSVAS